jgi:hypothetical protein
MKYTYDQIIELVFIFLAAFLVLQKEQEQDALY